MVRRSGRSLVALPKGLITDPATSIRLSRVRQLGTTPELVVRGVLTALGHRYRVRNRDLPGSPDVANRARRWVVFVHGCFWHRHPRCPKATTPKRNREFWTAKFKANKARDARVQRALLLARYRIVVIWECDTERARAALTAALRAKLPTRCRRYRS